MDAMGGREAITALGGLSVEAECNGPGGAFRTFVDSLRPDSVRFRQSSDDGETVIWSTAERTWTVEPDGTTRPLGEEVRGFVRDHEFHLLVFEVENRYADHRLGDEREIDGRDCRSIEMVDAAGRPASLWVEEESGLPLALELNPEQAMGPLHIRFDDWRVVEGVRFFHSFVLGEGADRSFTYRYVKIDPDGVDPEVFAPPHG